MFFGNTNQVLLLGDSSEKKKGTDQFWKLSLNVPYQYLFQKLQ